MSDELPEGWAEATLGDVITGFEAGRNLRAKGGPAGPGECGVLKISAVTWGSFRPEENKALLPGDEPKPHERVRNGDLLITRANTSDLVGAVVLVERDHPQLMLPDKILRLRLKDATIDRRYLLQALRTQTVREHFERNATGTSESMRNLSQPKMAAAPITLAPLPEQHRIVEAVEALLEHVNRARERLDRVPLILKRFRQAVLAAACSGRLTEEWRGRHDDRGSAARQLEDLFVQRRRDHEQRLATARVSGTRKPTPAKNLEPAKVPDDLPELPTGWAWVLFDDVCDDITVGHVGPMANEYVEHGVPFLRSQNVRPFRFDPQGLKYVAPAFHQRLAKSALKPGDIAVVRSGNAGEACVIPKELSDANCADLVVMRPSRVLDPYFAAIFINSSAARAHIDEVKVGIAQGHYNIGSARETPVPLPPMAEQAEIVRQVEKLFALADTIERRVEAATARADKLPQAILSKAFSGELVPTEADLARAEGRTYEMATDLLARVASETSERVDAGNGRRAPKSGRASKRRAG